MSPRAPLSLLHVLSVSLVGQFFVAANLIAVAPAADMIPVGTAKIDITPAYPVRLTGYGNRREESQGVAQRIWAKAIAFGDDTTGGPAVWITYENCGLTPEIRDEVAKKLSDHDVRSERLVVGVTHSHTAPTLTNWAPHLFGADIPPEHQRHIDQYTRELTEMLIRVGKAALEDRRPARVSWGVGKVGFAVNRRVLRDGKWTGFGVQADGPVDHSLPILAIRDEAGKLRACIANYACHCTTLGGNFNQIAGDWAGYAQSAVEADHPGSIAMITIGCGADANPEPRKDDLAVCENQGRQLADEVKRLLKGELRPLTSPLACNATTIDLPFEPARTREEWNELAKGKDVTGYHARMWLKRLDAGERPPTSLKYPLATWTFGDQLALVFLGGEVVVDYAIRLKTEFDADRLWLTAYANDVPCYIPSRRILREGGYEADRSMALYGRPNRFAPDVEDLIVDAVQKLLPHSFYSKPKQVDFPPPRSPAEALATITVLDGWKIELVAAEPLVQDPVAFDWGPDGKFWVAEMGDYPNGAVWNQPGDRLGVPGGRIKLLVDDNHDGKYDRASVFLDNVPFPNGVKAWRNGVLVTAAPDIFYAEDEDGDGRADRRDVLFSGFVEGNQQHRANGLRWGVDNWLYVANGDSGGKIRSHKTGAEVAISGRDVRLRPDTGEIEAQSGQTQFGRCRDDWNQWFGGNNSNPLWHYVLEDHYLRRNPHLAPPAVRRDVPEVPGAAPVFPTSRTLARFNDFHTANRFTSACSPEIYRDDRFAELLGTKSEHVFICEPVHNLVHHEVMSPEGISFRSRRAEGEADREFFASSDNWCRPVMVRTGPDGAIWIADMYRQVIEHPEWIPMTFQRKLDLRAGSDRGRIYRVAAREEKPRQQNPHLATLATPELVAALDHPNGWQRDTAQQLLLWRNDATAVPLLEQMARSSPRPLARLHALATLDGLHQLQPKTLQGAIQDQHPGIRIHAARMAESQLSGNPDLALAVARLTSDDDLRVRMQAALSLGAWPDPQAGRYLAAVARKDSDNEYLTAAVLSSIRRDNVATFAAEYLQKGTPPARLTQRLLTIASKLGDRQEVNRITAAVLEPAVPDSIGEPWSVAVDLLIALRQANVADMKSLDPTVRSKITAMVTEARRVAPDLSQPVNLRLLALKMLGAQPDPTTEDAQILRDLISPRHPAELQSAAVTALAARFPEAFPGMALSGWNGHSPALRTQILDAIFSRPASILEFLAALAKGTVPSSQLDARRRQQLLTHVDGRIREQAAKVLGSPAESSRQEIISRFEPVVSMQGDSSRGKATFSKRCAVCHKLEGTGQNVGPDLTALTDKSPRSLLIALLDPNKAVEDKFLDFIAVTEDGRQITGMLANETSNSVTLVGQEGKQVTLQRNEIELLQSSGKSLMPEGLEKDLTEQDFADVIAYVRSVSLPPKSFPGNHPEVAHVRDDGSIRLLAMNARIYGPTLVFENKYRNLGYWQSVEDHAVWEMNVPKSGKYAVRIDYACDDTAAGNRFQLSVGEQTVGGVVSGSGSWDRYRGATVGTVELKAGPAELLMRSDGTIRNALMDLRQIILEPQ